MATANGKVVLFGGYDTGSDLADTWEWDGTSWTQRLDAKGPAARSEHTMTTLGNKAILFGGNDGTRVFSDVWQWDGIMWTCLSSCSDPADAGAGSPSARLSSAMAAFGGTLVLFGGADSSIRADTWTWSGSSWSSGPAGPPSRYRHVMATAR
jgi:hypothetical protein